MKFVSLMMNAVQDAAIIQTELQHANPCQNAVSMNKSCANLMMNAVQDYFAMTIVCVKNALWAAILVMIPILAARLTNVRAECVFFK